MALASRRRRRRRRHGFEVAVLPWPTGLKRALPLPFVSTRAVCRLVLVQVKQRPGSARQRPRSAGPSRSQPAGGGLAFAEVKWRQQEGKKPSDYTDLN